MQTTVRIDPGPAGKWMITFADRPQLVAGKSLNETIELARRLAEPRPPAELIVCDAYHRVIQRERCGGAAAPEPAPTADPVRGR
jgi:hypothetical protein